MNKFFWLVSMRIAFLAEAYLRNMGFASGDFYKIDWFILQRINKEDHSFVEQK